MPQRVDARWRGSPTALLQHCTLPLPLASGHPNDAAMMRCGLRAPLRCGHDALKRARSRLP